MGSMGCARCTATVRTTPPGSGGGLTTWNALPAAASAPASTTPIAGSAQRAGVQAGRQFRSAQLGSMGAICQLWRDPWRVSQRGVGAGKGPSGS
ncbi:unnamed protein product [Gadus morhua 'NCC']